MGLLTGAELWSVAIFFAIFLLLVDLMHRRHRWTARYPPGPMSLPVLGNLLQVDFQNMPAGFQKVRELLEVRRGHQNTGVVVQLHAAQELVPRTKQVKRLPSLVESGTGPEDTPNFPKSTARRWDGT